MFGVRGEDIDWLAEVQQKLIASRSPQNERLCHVFYAASGAVGWVFR